MKVPNSSSRRPSSQQWTTYVQCGNQTDDGVGNLIPTQVTSTDQIVEIVAKAARRRLATSGSTSALVEYTIAITKVIYGEMDVAEVQTF